MLSACLAVLVCGWLNADVAGVGVTPSVAFENQSLKNITFDDLKFELATKETPFKRSMLTSAIEDLVGKRVRVRGYILPTFQQTGLTQLVLMRDNMECCFGPGAWIYDCVIVQMNPGHTADYTTRAVAVEGTFSIEELPDPEGVIRAIYRIDADAVE
jgi:hypothetical protein